MKKAMKSLVLVIPLVALMSAPAGANNKKRCDPQKAPQPPGEAPPLPKGAAEFDRCETKTTMWKKEECEPSNNPKDFCATVNMARPASNWHFVVRRDSDGALVCDPRGVQFETPTVVFYDVPFCVENATIK